MSCPSCRAEKINAEGGHIYSCQECGKIFTTLGEKYVR